MKRLFSFFFLLLILLNTIGYYEVLLFMERQNYDQAVQKISGNENEISGNLLLKIPLASRFNEDDREYRKAQGEITVEGELYHFVKQKLYQDTLYIICLRDTKTSEVRDALSDLSRTMADQNHKSGNTQKGVDVSFAKFYTLSATVKERIETGWSRLLQHVPVTNLYHFSALASIFHPPCLG
ncbi:hypothetical protein [Chryseolinea soli]|uniref:Uncharacterized protein n=1 Tax=Chryseolinea soli TaxID=2321403 RepID=A0A385SIL4_9BACT|nr:hypothetical protein [Chryseolinea soli]AYB31583.1 hypothetical protein D4L85_13845 [Chryseolinea soli]